MCSIPEGGRDRNLTENHAANLPLLPGPVRKLVCDRDQRVEEQLENAGLRCPVLYCLENLKNILQSENANLDLSGDNPFHRNSSPVQHRGHIFTHNLASLEINAERPNIFFCTVYAFGRGIAPTQDRQNSTKKKMKCTKGAGSSACNALHIPITENAT